MDNNAHVDSKGLLNADCKSSKSRLPQSPHGFITEIDHNELQIKEMIGRGAYGTVHKAYWCNRTVAIKTPEKPHNTKEFRDEAQQLSIVRHKNIIQLYGTSINGTEVCLVMEYADCGSLHSLLHPSADNPKIPYTFSHVISWSLQCAEAVEYLHTIKPKAIIHRDLKPPNMLLTNCGILLKICDFGTACHTHTEMTCNIGTAAWMAPEVFGSSKYTEKCDVYSFGIILWEMLTRKKPYDGTAPYPLLWQVHNGTRPPPIQGIPKSLENLMQRCWEQDEMKRPTFIDISNYFRKALMLVSGADVPLEGFLPRESTTPEHAPQSEHVMSATPPPEGWNPEVIKLHPIPILPHVVPPTSSPISNKPISIDLSPVNHHADNKPSADRIGMHRAVSTPVISQHHDSIPHSSSVSDLEKPVEFNLVPPELMPILPITDEPTSEKMYQNYRGALKKYITIQESIEFLKQRKEVLTNNLEEMKKEQNRNSCFMADYLAAQQHRQELLQMHSSVKSQLDKAKAQRVKSTLHSVVRH